MPEQNRLKTPGQLVIEASDPSVAESCKILLGNSVTRPDQMFDRMLLGVFPAVDLLVQPTRKFIDLEAKINGFFHQKEDQRDDGSIWILINHNDNTVGSLEVNQNTLHIVINGLEETDEVVSVYFLPEPYSRYQSLLQSTSAKLFSGEKPLLDWGYFPFFLDAFRTTCLQVDRVEKRKRTESQTQTQLSAGKIFDNNFREALQKAQVVSNLSIEDKNKQLNFWTEQFNSAITKSEHERSIFDHKLELVRSGIQSVDSDPLLRQITTREGYLKMCSAALAVEAGIRLADLGLGSIPIFGLFRDALQAILKRELTNKNSDKIIELFREMGIYVSPEIFKGKTSAHVTDLLIELTGTAIAGAIPGDQTAITLALEILAQGLNFVSKLKFSSEFIRNTGKKHQSARKLRDHRTLMGLPPEKPIIKAAQKGDALIGKIRSTADRLTGSKKPAP